MQMRPVCSRLIDLNNFTHFKIHLGLGLGLLIGGVLISNTPKNWLLVALLEQGGVPESTDFHFTTS